MVFYLDQGFSNQLDNSFRREMAQETKQTQAPVLCVNGCGFYGNLRTNGMCSVCYKDTLQRQNSNMRVSPPELSGGGSIESESSPVPASPALSSAATTLEQSSVVSSQSAEEADSQKDRTALQTKEPQEASCSTSESRVASEQEQCIMGQQEAAGSSGAGHGSRVPAADLGCRRGKRKLEEMEHQGQEADSSVLDDSDLASVDGQSHSPDKLKQKKNRCFTCHKKVGLTGVGCRCGNIFCGTHRYSDMHNCSFDYKAEAAEKIRKENPVVVGVKIHKI